MSTSGQDIVEQTKDLMTWISESCIRRKLTVSVAESVTSGCLQLLLSNAVSARDFFQGGITAYNGAQKTRHLSVEPIHALGCQCVSEKVSREMALHVCSLFCSEIGIGITGYASLVPEEGIDELYAHVAIAQQGNVVLHERLKPLRADSHGLQAQEEYAVQVMELLKNVLAG